jgi:hypothetical protein
VARGRGSAGQTDDKGEAIEMIRYEVQDAVAQILLDNRR